jgi:hypothetical protein
MHNAQSMHCACYSMMQSVTIIKDICVQVGQLQLILSVNDNTQQRCTAHMKSRLPCCVMKTRALEARLMFHKALCCCCCCRRCHCCCCCVQWDNVQITCGTTPRRAFNNKGPVKKGKLHVQVPRCKACKKHFAKAAQNSTRLQVVKP